jgi:hypothetical protein
VNGKQHAVLWMGILLIVVRMFTTNQWHEIWSAVSQGSILPGFGVGGSNIFSNPFSGLTNPANPNGFTVPWTGKPDPKFVKPGPHGKKNVYVDPRQRAL